MYHHLVNQSHRDTRRRVVITRNNLGMAVLRRAAAIPFISSSARGLAYCGERLASAIRKLKDMANHEGKVHVSAT